MTRSKRFNHILFIVPGEETIQPSIAFVLPYMIQITTAKVHNIVEDGIHETIDVFGNNVKYFCVVTTEGNFESYSKKLNTKKNLLKDLQGAFILTKKPLVEPPAN